MDNDQLACVYAALILADDGVPITAEKLKTLLSAAKVDVEPFWPTMYAKAFSQIDVKDLCQNLSSGAGGGGAASAAVAADAAAPAETKKEEAKKEDSDSDDGDMFGGGLFD